MNTHTFLATQVELGPIQPPSQQFSVDSAARNNPGGVLTNFESMISVAIGLLTVFAGLFFVMFFFLAALKWVTAGNDSSKVGKARDEMVQGVIGLIVVIAAYGIIGLLGTIFGLDILNPSAVINTLVESMP